MLYGRLSISISAAVLVGTMLKDSASRNKGTSVVSEVPLTSPGPP